MSARKADRRIWFALLVTGGGGILLLGLALPVAFIVGNALVGEAWDGWRSPATLDAVRLSIMTSATALLITVLLGTPLAYRQSRSQSAAFITTLTDLPIVLPPSAAGLGLLLVFGRTSPLGRLFADAGVQIPFTTLAVVIAQIFVSAPFYVRAARTGFAAIDDPYVEAALVAGADEYQLLRYVFLPLNRRAIASGAVLCWARALGEFGATLMFAGNLPGRTQTMPLAIFIGLERDLEVALVLATLLIGISFVILSLLGRLEREQL